MLLCTSACSFQLHLAAHWMATHKPMVRVKYSTDHTYNTTTFLQQYYTFLFIAFVFDIMPVIILE